jgi:hypothetical protein
MKKIITTSLFKAILALAAVVIATSSASAQDVYYPITDGCIWSVSNEKYMTAGDTVLDGKTYLKVYRQEGNQPFEFNLEEAEYFAAIRNDLSERKVYAYLPTGTWIRDLVDYSVIQTDSAMEVLLYDFSLEIGDTVCYYSIGSSVTKSYAIRAESANIYVGQHDYSAVTHQYSAADTLVYLSDNSSRNQILLQGLSYFPKDNVWIEGIGGIRGFDEGAQMNLSDYGQRVLLCFTDSFGAYFQTEFDLDDTSDDCFSNGFGGDVTEREEMAAKIYPNPTDDVLYIELSGMEIANVALYDLQGRIVGANNHSPLQGTTATLSLKSVPAGVYLLRVTDTEEREYHRKVVKK